MSSKYRSVENIKYRMKVLGVDLEKHIASILNRWENGFNFVPHDWKAFSWDLKFSGRFCIDTSLAKRFQEKGTLSWRQTNDKSSLHVLFRKGKPYPQYKRIIKYYQIHLDSVSVVAGQDESGKCYYAIDHLAKHNIVDKWKLPFIVPDRKGLRVGIRFSLHSTKIVKSDIV